MPPLMSVVACSCSTCRPDRSARCIWLATSVIGFGGALAMAIDLGGFTPALARLLGMMS